MLQFLKGLTAAHKPKEKKLFLIEDVNPPASTKDNSNLPMINESNETIKEK
jgi:hypothetical protein